MRRLDGEERWGRHEPPCVPWPVQLRHQCSLSGEDYVARSAWRDASLVACPRHPRGGCGMVRHGTYRRTTPTGLRIARYYCPTARETFSLLPDCLASRFPGELDDLERVVAHVEAAVSIEAAADVLRPDIVLPSAVRWVRRRLTLVRATLLTVVTLFPDLFQGAAQLAAVRAALDTEHALVTLRARAAARLPVLPRPLGLCPPPDRPRGVRAAPQHGMGADPDRPSG